ncbi:TPA: shikimate dehydrogenase [Klebsiella variicola]|nr:shikimate dehydrogenase [Klebsiella variicola]
MVSGTTQVVAVIGHPIAQVKSPDNFNRYFAEQHMDSVMIPVDIAPDAVVDYLNAINVIRKLADGRLQGDMLDGVGFQLAAEAQGFQPAGKQALLSGCGGVGSAIAWGLCEAGIRQLALHDQNPTTRQRLHDLLAEAFPAVQLNALPDTLHGVDLLVNGSPAGMAGFDALPLPQALLDTLDSATHVADVVTAPVMTPLLTFAAARGCRVQTGPEMALAQMTLMGQFIGAIPPAQGAAA